MFRRRSAFAVDCRSLHAHLVTLNLDHLIAECRRNLFQGFLFGFANENQPLSTPVLQVANSRVEEVNDDKVDRAARHEYVVIVLANVGECTRARLGYFKQLRRTMVSSCFRDWALVKG